MTSVIQFCSLLAGLAMLAAPQRAHAQSAAAPARPNILFCLADDVSYPHMGAYGCRWVKTPGFDRVAREGLLFTRAYTPNAKCAPSRACILTGRNSWQLEAAANHVCYFPAKFKTYAETLGEHGYHVGYTAKGWAPGDPGKVDGKPRELTGKQYSQRKAPPPTTGISNIDYAANFRDFLADRPQGKPFCFWYGGLEPHRGYEYGSGVAKGGKQTSDLPGVPAFWPDNSTVRNDMLDYAFEIEHFDLHLRRMLDALAEMGELENTLVVVTADNGMPFPRCKAQEYEYSNHMPLAMMWKRGIRAPGRTIDDYVSFIDLAPLFLEVAGVAPGASGMQPIQGRGLSAIFRAERGGRVDPARDHLLIGKERHDVGRPGDVGYPIRGIFADGWLYLRNFAPDRWPGGNPETGYLECDGGPTKTECLQARTQPGREQFWRWSFGKRSEEEMYHVSVDPECMRDLAADPQQQERKARLKAQLMAELTQQGDPRVFGHGDQFDAYPYAGDAQRGFYERQMRGEKIRAGWVNPTDAEKAPTP